MEAWLKKCELLYLCCIMMFKWINKHPGIQKFWNWCSHYQEIYDWISPFNIPSGLWFILTQQSMGGDYGKSGNLSVFTVLKHLMLPLKCSFFRASLLHLIEDTDSMQGDVALFLLFYIFFKLKHFLTIYVACMYPRGLQNGRGCMSVCLWFCLIVCLYINARVNVYIQ